MEVAMDIRTYRTSDMSLVTYLGLEGFESQDVVWENGTCYWYFILTAHLTDLVDHFVSGAARVDPRVFAKRFAQTRREFHEANTR